MSNEKHRQPCYCMPCKYARWVAERNQHTHKKAVLHVVRYELWHYKYRVHLKLYRPETDINRYFSMEESGPIIGCFESLNAAEAFAKNEGKHFADYNICKRGC